MDTSKQLIAIENAKAVLENGIIWDAVIIIKDGRIASYGWKHETEIPTGALRIDANGAYVGPGFVDIHVHNGAGHSTSFDLVGASKYFLEHGETSILATPSYGMNLETMTEAIKSIKASASEAKTFRGIYFEGPYTNPNYGSHAYNNPWRHGIVQEEFRTLVDEAGALARVWTIAPERENIIPFLEYARSVNPEVIFALGHSEATPAQVRALGKYRPKIMTHTFDATGRVSARPGLRGAGPDEYAMKEPDVYCELISDSMGIHVSSEMQQLLIHTKGYSRIMLITDSTTYDNPNPPIFAHAKDLNFGDRGEIAGSKLTMDRACKNIMTHTNSGIAQTFLMASTNPARCLGLDNELGRIDTGLRADLVFVDDQFNIKNVMLEGELQQF